MSKPLPLSPRDTARVTQLLERPAPCVLCGQRQTTHAGLFVPDHPEVWGGVQGRRRLIGYRLCPTCMALPAEDKVQRIEATLAAGIVGRRNGEEASP